MWRAKGWHVELVASEPMIESSVAVSSDDQGRLYVREMRGYMNDINGAGEDKPVGRISRLEDPDGDGSMDKATVVCGPAVRATNAGRTKAWTSEELQPVVNP